MTKYVLSFALTIVLSAAIRGQICFKPKDSYPVQVNPLTVLNSDFNNDGKIDIAVCNQGAASISLLLGNGTGSFAPAVNFTITDTPFDMASGDFNFDGNIDLITANASTSNLTILLGNGSGSFSLIATFTANANSEPIGITSGDFNNDFKLDFITANFGTGDFSLFIGNGAGGFSSPVSFTLTNGAFKHSEAITADDFNGDGNLDVGVTNWNATYILLGDGTGGFSNPVGFGPTRGSIISGDFNMDGKKDIAVTNNQDYAVSVLLGDGSGNFSSYVNFPTGTNPLKLALTDFNSDSKPDIAVSNFGSGVSILIGDGNGLFYPSINLLTGLTPSGIVSTDYDVDGRMDLAVASYSSNNVSVFLRSANPVSNISISSNFTSVCVGESVTITANGASTYTWNTSQISQTISVTPTVTTTYYLSATDPNGCYVNSKFTQTVSACIGINELNLTQEDLLIYPNPNNGVFKIKSETRIEGLEIVIFDLVGRKVHQQKIFGEENDIVLNQLPKGLYLYKSFKENEQVGNGKIIIE
jgi:hypothetical protein